MNKSRTIPHPVMLMLGTNAFFTFIECFKIAKIRVKRQLLVTRTNLKTSQVLINAYNCLNEALNQGIEDEDFVRLYCEEMQFVDIYQEESIPKEGRDF